MRLRNKKGFVADHRADYDSCDRLFQTDKPTPSFIRYCCLLGCAGVLFLFPGCGSGGDSSQVGAGQTQAPTYIPVNLPKQLVGDGVSERIWIPKDLAASDFTAQVTFTLPAINYGAEVDDLSTGSSTLLQTILPTQSGPVTLPLVGNATFNGSTFFVDAVTRIPNTTGFLPPSPQDGCTVVLQNTATGETFAIDGDGVPSGSFTSITYTQGSAGSFSDFNGTHKLLKKTSEVVFPSGWTGRASKQHVYAGTNTTHWDQATSDLTMIPPQELKSLTIANPQADSLDPASGGSTSLGFDLIATGLGPTPHFNWTVSVVDSDSQAPLYKFIPPAGADGPGNVTTSGGTSLHVDLPWDGRNDQNQPVTSNFTWVIDAQAQRLVAGGNGGDNAVAQASRPNAIPTLKIDQSTAGTLLSVKDQKQDRDPLLVVNENRNLNWEITASNLRFNGPTPGSITANIQSAISNVTVTPPVTLTLVGTNTFKGNYSIDPALVTPASNAPSHSYTLVQKYGITEAEMFGKVYPAALFPDPNKVLAFGTLFEYLNIPPQPNSDYPELFKVKPAVAPTGFTNFISSGFEGVNVTLAGAGLQSKLTGVAKISHPAEVLVIDLHGRHDGSMQLVGPLAAMQAGISTELIKPTDTGFSVSSATRKVLAVSCEAFDLRDYNNFFSDLHFKDGHPPKATLTQTAVTVANTTKTFDPRTSFGGELWFNAYRAVSPHNTVLLGYNAPAPIDVQPLVAKAYAQNLAQVSNPTPEQDILAWLRANRSVASTSKDGLSWLCLSACGYDVQNEVYYYIAFNAPGGIYKKNPPAQTPGTVKGRGIFKLPKASWNLEAADWQNVPQKTLDANGKVVPLAEKLE